MTSHSNRMLAGGDLDYTGNAYEVHIELSCPIPDPLDKVGSIIFKILVGIEY